MIVVSITTIRWAAAITASGNQVCRRGVFNGPQSSIENVPSTKSRRPPGPEDDFRSRPRRRGAALEKAILDAAWEELGAVGYRDFTIEGVAARAKTGKQAIYRRWPGRPQLVVAAMREHAPAYSGEVPDTGELRGDVLALLRRAAERLADVGAETVHGLLAEVIDRSEMRMFVDGRNAGVVAMGTILERAAARGEVDLARVGPRVASLPVDLLRHELLVGGESVTDATVVEIVDDVFLPLVQAGG
jgi:AcrR family transcriptional regulator